MNTSTSRVDRRTLFMAAGAGIGTMLAERSVAAQQPSTPMASPEASPEALGAARVRFTVGDTEIVVAITENPTSNDLLSMLPLELTFEDFASMEKISYLPRELTTEGSAWTAPQNGDLIYFAPWGNLGFFYDAARRDKSFDDRVFLIGKVETGFERLADLETGPVQVELVS